MKTVLKIIIAIFILLNMLVIGFLFYPVPKALESLRPDDTVKIYDRSNQLLFEIPNKKTGRKSFIELEKIPNNVKNAFLSIEDRRFYEHSGVDVKSILRAIWQNVSAGEVVSGGSTITQQVVRNMIGINKKRTFLQKIHESVLALKINKSFDKDRIFEVYLNSIYFGGLAYGVEAASWQYYNKSVVNLDLAQAAFLAGLPQAPNRYYPFKNFEKAKKRQKEVLSAMHKNSKIDISQFNQATSEKITLSHSSKWTKNAPHFVDFVLQSIKKDGKTELPKKIITTLNFGMQKRVEKILSSEITFLAKYNIENAAAIILDAKNGDVYAMVGSVDYKNKKIDGAVNVTTSLRQPGSSIKPLVYALAIEKGLNADSIITDEPISFTTADGLSYAPKNFDLKYHGNVTLAQSLAQSLNIPAVKTLNFVGIKSFLNTAKAFGIKTFDKSSEHYGLSLALGSGEVRLLELVNAYSVFANGGKRMDVRLIAPESTNDKSRLQTTVIKPSTAKTISEILSNNKLRMPAFGEENPLKFSFPVAAKTGTTRNFRDNWTIGYTDDYIVGVWVGNSSGAKMEGISGISGAGPIFHKIMNMLHEMTGTKLTVGQNISVGGITDISYEGANRDSRLQGNSASNKLTTTTNTTSSTTTTSTPATTTPTTNSFRIISPFANDIFLFDPKKPKDSQKINLQASQKAKWYINGKLIGEGISILWPIIRGKHQIKAISSSDERLVGIEVK